MKRGRFDLANKENLVNRESYAEFEHWWTEVNVKRLKLIEVFQKQGNWAPCELNPRDIERRFCTFGLLLPLQRRKVFWRRIVTGDNNEYMMLFLKAGNHGASLTNHPHQQQIRIYIVWKWCSVFGLLRRGRLYPPTQMWSNRNSGSLPTSTRGIDPSLESKMTAIRQKTRQI